jgi:DNA-binding NarL/FixJ family response regulator
MPIHIAIVDDKPLNRQALKQKLHEYAEINLLFEAKNGKDFVEKIKLADSKPEVVLMDLEMPEMNGIETINFASAAYPNTKFIVLTIFEDNDKIFEAIKAGASGYLLKEESGVNIVDAITNVYEYNGIPMSPVIARKAMELLKQLPTTTLNTNKNEDKSEILSDREIEILKELSTGKNYKAIGETLFISPMTVRKHVSNIYNKLHVGSKAQLVNIAHKKNWL